MTLELESLARETAKRVSVPLRDGYVDDAAKIILDALEQAGAIPAWQRIETAPKDGTEIDAWIVSDGGKYGHRDTIRWRKEIAYVKGRWEHYTLDNSGGYGEMEWKSLPDYGPPTHWMAQPAAPTPPTQRDG